MKDPEQSTNSADTKFLKKGQTISFKDAVFNVPYDGFWRIENDAIFFVGKIKTCSFCEEHCGNDWCVTKEKDD